MEEHIVDVLGMADVNLMRLSHERIIPHFDKGIVAHAEHEMTVVLEINCVEFVAM